MVSSDNKALRVLQKIAVKKSFNDDIIRLRTKYGVPLNGFSTRAAVDEWDAERDNEYVDSLVDIRALKKFKDYDADIDNLLGAHSLPPTLFPLVTDYIASNKIEYGDRPYFSCAIDVMEGPFQTLNENRWRKGGKKFIKLLISDDADMGEVRRFVKERWSEIRARIRPFDKTTKRSKISKNWELNQTVYRLSRKKKMELSNELGDGLGTKEIMIGKLLPKYGFPRKSADAVKKIIERELEQRKSDK